MKNRFLQGDDLFDSDGFSIGASFAPWWTGHSTTVFATTPDAVRANQGTAPTTTVSHAASTVVVTTGGITFDLIFDAAAMAAPAAFRAGIQQAATILANSISDKITVNLHIDYSGTGGGAAAGPDGGLYESYSLIRSDLMKVAAPGDTTFNFLPSGTSIQGQSNVAVWNAELKLFGLMGANDTTSDDGSAYFATDINPNLLVGVALHELTHALGRVPYGSAPDIFDLFRFTSPGVRLFQGGATAPASYFSLDGGVTKLADFGQHSDPSDFLNTGVQGPNDPFDEFYNGSTGQALSSVDLKLLHALGYHIGSTTPPALADLSISGFNLDGHHGELSAQGHRNGVGGGVGQRSLSVDRQHDHDVGHVAGHVCGIDTALGRLAEREHIVFTADESCRRHLLSRRDGGRDLEGCREQRDQQRLDRRSRGRRQRQRECVGRYQCHHVRSRRQ